MEFAKMNPVEVEFAAINPITISEDIKQHLAYCYSFKPSYCLYNDVCDDANDFLHQFDLLINDFLVRSGIRRYIAGNVVVVADYDEHKMYGDDIDYCDAIAATFKIYDHQVIIRPCVVGLMSANSTPKLGLDIKIPDYCGYHINRREAMGVIRQWVINDQVSQLIGLGKTKGTKTTETKATNPIEQLLNDVNKLAQETAVATAEEPKPIDSSKDQWCDMAVPEKALVYSTNKAFKFKIPSGHEYSDWCFWWPRKRVYAETSTMGKVYLLGYINDQDEVTIERLKNDGTWDKETKTITIQKLESAFELEAEELPF